MVLGAGHVGNAIARDLHQSGIDVTTADSNKDSLKTLKEIGIKVIPINIQEQSELKKIIKDQDLIVGALPGALGFKMMKFIIESGKNMVDISFCPEDYLQLDELALKMNVSVIADIGVAPGMCNVICGYHHKRMEVKSYKCIVGGLPAKREWPLEYKASWSPIDVIEEYTRPARYIEHGKLVVRPAMSDPELVDFDNIGTLEEWNSDGLRSMIKTMPDIPNMIEKTLRYPGTIEYLRVLRELGFFSTEPVEINGTKVKPIELSSKLLFPRWKLDHGEKEFTVMRITLEGREAGKKKRYIYDLYDEYDKETETSSMARATGYTCTGAVNLLLKGMYTRKGVSAPEFLGEDEENFRFLLNHLSDRGVNYKIRKG